MPPLLVNGREIGVHCHHCRQYQQRYGKARIVHTLVFELAHPGASGSAMIAAALHCQRQFIGPADAGLARLKDVYRKVLYLKSADLSALLSVKEKLEPELVREERLRALNIQFDMDPVNPF